MEGRGGDTFHPDDAACAQTYLSCVGRERGGARSERPAARSAALDLLEVNSATQGASGVLRRVMCVSRPPSDLRQTGARIVA